MSNQRMSLLTLGAFIIIIAIVIIAYAAGQLSWLEIIPLIVALYGCWLMIESGVRWKNPSKYARSAFSVFGWGILLAVIGFGLDLTLRGVDLLYTVAVVLLLLGVLAVIAALKTTSKKPNP
ncbi:MAG: hypothetical protein ACUVT5_01305 [Candidatus Bathyarchaeales archaeon]